MFEDVFKYFIELLLGTELYLTGLTLSFKQDVCTEELIFLYEVFEEDGD